MSEPSKPPIIVFLMGVEPGVKQKLEPLLKGCTLLEEKFTLDRLTEPIAPFPHLVVLGPPSPSVSPIHTAQTVRMTYRDVPVYLVSETMQEVDRKSLIKNGFSEVYLLPIDTETMKRSIMEHLSKVSHGEIKTYHPVKLIDIQAGEKLDFDIWIYLASNRKYLKFALAGDDLEKERLEQLLKKNIRSVYVTTDQLKKFYFYTANQLAKIGNSDLSHTEKKEKLQSCVREVMTGLFNNANKRVSFEQGSQLIKDCKEIANSYILSSATGDIYAKIQQTVGESANTYNHAANVSTFAALFSIGLQVGDPAELATAGLLHDVGLAEVPAEITAKSEFDWSQAEREHYQRHPEFSLALLQKKKTIISGNIIKMIQQHHEYFNGTGYPLGLEEKQITPEAQILAMADRFDEMTSAVDGKALKTADEAIEYFRIQASKPPGSQLYDPELVKGLMKLFPKKDEGQTPI